VPKSKPKPNYLHPTPGDAKAILRFVGAFIHSVKASDRPLAAWELKLYGVGGNPLLTATGPSRAVRLIHEPPPGEGENDFDYWTTEAVGSGLPELVLSFAPTAVNLLLAVALLTLWAGGHDIILAHELLGDAPETTADRRLVNKAIKRLYEAGKRTA
jgi:hypothetical protein